LLTTYESLTISRPDVVYDHVNYYKNTGTVVYCNYKQSNTKYTTVHLYQLSLGCLVRI